MKLSPNAVSFWGLLVWFVLTMANAVSLVVTSRDLVKGELEDEAGLSRDAKINGARSGLLSLQRTVGDYILNATQEHAQSVAAARSAVLTKVRELHSSADSKLEDESIDEIDKALKVEAHRIDTLLTSQSDPSGTASLRSGSDLAELFVSIHEASERLAILATKAIQMEVEDDQRLYGRIRNLVISAGIASALCFLVQVWIFVRIRKDMAVRNVLQEELASSNRSLNDRVRESTRELAERNWQLERISRRVIDLQEEERKRIALQLHDEIGQDLSALLMLQRKLARDVPTKVGQATRGVIADCVVLTEALYERVAKIAVILRPAVLDRLGLTAAVHWYVREAAKLSDCKITASAFDVPDRLPQHESIAAFRILQEAVTNAIRHAQARHIDVQVCSRQQLLCICITDDGVGFSKQDVVCNADPHVGIGLLGMQERAQNAGGSLRVESELGRGTRVIVEFPLEMTSPIEEVSL